MYSADSWCTHRIEGQNTQPHNKHAGDSKGWSLSELEDESNYGPHERGRLKKHLGKIHATFFDYFELEN